MFGSTPGLIPFVVACLLLCASGGRIATAQTVADDTANHPRIELEMILQNLHQQQQWNLQQNERINELEEESQLLSESSDNELRQVPTTDVSYTLGVGHHNEDYGTSLEAVSKPLENCK